MGKETRIALRVSDEKKDRLTRAAKTVGLNETTLVEACVDALIDYVETNGEITTPLVIVPKKAYLAMVAARTDTQVPRASFRSTVLPQSPDDVISSRLNEESAKPRSTAVPTPEKPLTKTRAVMRKIAKGKSPQP